MSRIPAQTTEKKERIVMDIKNSVAFVTGANRGIGKAFVAALQEAGAKKIYAAARDIASLAEILGQDSERIVPRSEEHTSELQSH
jgi:NAD(P)-dependent dehydrogenase (short-subunit alcohol dehydrogenase family)